MLKFNLSDKNEEEKKLLEQLNAKALAVKFDYNRNTFLSCTCGFNKLYKTTGYSTERVPNSCPNCNNTNIFTLGDDGEFTVVKWNFEELSNTDKEIVLAINPIVLYYSETELTSPELDSPALYIRYDKEEKTLEANIDSDFSPADDIEISCKDNWIDLYIYSYNDGFYDYCLPISEETGLKQLYEYLKQYIDFSMDDYSDEAALFDILFEAQCALYPLVNEMINNNLIKVRTSTDLFNIVNKFKPYNLDLNDTFEHVFDMSIEDYSSFKDIDSLLRYKSFFYELEKTNMAEYLEFKNINMSIDETNILIAVFNRSKCDSFAMFLRYVVRGHSNDGLSIRNILSHISDIISDDKEYLLKWDSAYSDKIYKRYRILKMNLLDEDSYEKLAKKPTLNTLYNIVSN